MPPLSIVEYRNPLEDGFPCLLAGSPCVLLDQFILEGREEALGHGVIIAVPRSAHGTADAERRQLRLVGMGHVLTPPVRMVDQLPSSWPPLPDRHAQSLEGELGAQM